MQQSRILHVCYALSLARALFLSGFSARRTGITVLNKFSDTYFAIFGYADLDFAVRNTQTSKDTKGMVKI